MFEVLDPLRGDGKSGRDLYIQSHIHFENVSQTSASSAAVAVAQKVYPFEFCALFDVFLILDEKKRLEREP